MAVKYFAAALALAIAAAPAALAEAFKVTVDQTVALKVPGSANSVVIGNASVADVTMHDSTTLLVTGKSFGSTNLMVLDAAGRTVYSNQVLVGGQADTDMTIIRSGSTYTYSCVDKCRSTTTVGDAPSYFQETLGTITAKSGVARGGN